MKRSNTSAFTRPRAKSGDLLLVRANSTGAAARTAPTHFGSPLGYRNGGWNEIEDTSSNSINEDDEEEDDQEWGLHKGMELFEVSAKDAVGE